MKKPSKTFRKLFAGENATIAAIGDSLTSGWMVRKGYTGFLQDALSALYPKSRIKFINAGRAGDTARDGLRRLRRDVLDHNPDCVLIQFGLNDAFCSYSPAQFATTIDKIVEEIRLDCDADIVLVTSNYLGDNEQNEYVTLFYEQMEKIADKWALSIARAHKHWQTQIGRGVDWYELVQPDGVHPTVKGHALMADAIIGLFTR